LAHTVGVFLNLQLRCPPLDLDGLVANREFSADYTDPPPAVPEPTTMVLSATGLALMALKRARARARG